MHNVAAEPGFGPAGQGGGAGVSAPPQAPINLRFLGSGSEYFRIWIVNLLLTIVTLGIYSAWAKVRSLQYFYRNTQLDGSGFDYHGKATAILKGRLIVFVLAVALNLSSHVSMILFGILMAVLALVFPWLLLRSLRFRLANSSYRGLRFRFGGTDREAYQVFLLWPVLSLVTFYLLAPFAHQRFKRFQHNNSYFGGTAFAFSGTPGAFYSIYLRTLGFLLLAVLVVFAVVSGGIFLIASSGGGREVASVFGGFIAVLGFYLALLAIAPFFQARLQNLIWNRTTLAAHGFASQVKARRLFWLFLTNLIGVAVTLGLFYPFAKVRLLRYKIEAMSLLPAGPLEAFVAGQSDQVGALGDAAADWYDIDLAL